MLYYIIRWLISIMYLNKYICVYVLVQKFTLYGKCSTNRYYKKQIHNLMRPIVKFMNICPIEHHFMSMNTYCVYECFVQCQRVFPNTFRSVPFEVSKSSNFISSPISVEIPGPPTPRQFTEINTSTNAWHLVLLFISNSPTILNCIQPQSLNHCGQNTINSFSSEPN